MRLFSLETKKVNFVPLTFLFFVSPLDLRDAFFFTGGLLDGPDCIHYATLSFSLQTLLLVQEQCHLKVMA